MLVKGLKIIGGIVGGRLVASLLIFLPAGSPDGCQAAGRKKARTVETIRAL